MRYLINTRPLGLQGHRGARGLYPENTLEGFRATHALGVKSVELDVMLTADGVVVVFHDLALNPDIVRDAQGAWLTPPTRLVRDMTYAELKALDVGRLRPHSAYAAEFPDQQPHDGARIPTLAEVLNPNTDLRFTIELKSDPETPSRAASQIVLADATLAVVDQAGIGSRVVLESFDWRGLRHIRRTRPDITLAWLTSSKTEQQARLWWDGPDPTDYGGSVPRAVAAEGGRIWAPAYERLTHEIIAEAHALGLLVLPWTVNDIEAMQRLLDWDVDGLITDRPDRLIALTTHQRNSS